MKKYLILIILLFTISQVQSADYALKPHEKNDTLLFESDAKLEFIVGKTTSIEGSFSFDIENPRDSVYGIIKVDLNTLKTSISTRDKHMQEEYLETDKFQYTYFEILQVDNLPEKINLDSLYAVNCEGFFYLHGVKKRLTAELTIMVPSGQEQSRINVTSKFHVLLEDYDIERPKLVLLKVAKQINLELSFTGFLSEKIEKIKIPSIYK